MSKGALSLAALHQDSSNDLLEVKRGWDQLGLTQEQVKRPRGPWNWRLGAIGTVTTSTDCHLWSQHERFAGTGRNLHLLDAP